MPETQAKETASRVIVPMTKEDLIYLQLKDFKDEFRDSRKELNQRMDRLEARQDKLDEKIDKLDAKIDKLADKIDELRHNKPITPTIYEKICVASASLAACGILYSALFK